MNFLNHRLQELFLWQSSPMRASSPSQRKTTKRQVKLTNELKLSPIILPLIGELQHVRHHRDREGPNSYSSHDNCKLLLLTSVPYKMRNFMDFPRTGGITGCKSGVFTEYSA
jgi:hypothetical protein